MKEIQNVWVLKSVLSTINLYFALPELGIRVHEAEPFIWQLVAVDPIWKFSPFQAFVTLYPVLIRSFPEDA